MAALFLGACATFQISIDPGSLVPSAPPSSARRVAYVISAVDLERKWADHTPGRGNTVTFYPYRDLEPGLRRMLESVYAKVTPLRSTSDDEAVGRAGISLLFIPTISSAIGRLSPGTSIPTDFRLLIDYRVLDPTGRELYRNTAHGLGRAYFSEIVYRTGNHALAGRRAAADALAKMREQIEKVSALR